jgi:hypothetical protein
MISKRLINRVSDGVQRHCIKKGYKRGPNWNPLTPWDSVAALAMADYLIGSDLFDEYIAIAPEGHVYGYFFEKHEAQVLSVCVDYPPKHVQMVDDLSGIYNRRVLLIEDDIISGISLSLVVQALAEYSPQSISLYLGRSIESQQLQNVPPSITNVCLAEKLLPPSDRAQRETRFIEFFNHIETKDM